MIGFNFDPDWTTRQLGKKIIQSQGEKDAVTIGEYFISINLNGSIELFKKYDNVKDSLRQVAKEISFEYDNNWNTRQFGSKIVDFILSTKK